MKQKGVIEIISFEILDGFTEEQISFGLKQLESFQCQYEARHGMNIAKSEDNITLVITYDSFDDEKNISARMMKSSATNDFKKIVNPQTVNKVVYPHYVLD